MRHNYQGDCYHCGDSFTRTSTYLDEAQAHATNDHAILLGEDCSRNAHRKVPFANPFTLLWKQPLHVTCGLPTFTHLA